MTAPAPHQPEWRDIASAPRDGETFLAWGEGHGHHVVFYDYQEPDGSGIRAYGTGELIGREQWCWSIPDGHTLHQDALTHWLPLPPPPTGDA